MTIVEDVKNYEKYLKMFQDRKTIEILDEEFVIEEFNIINDKMYIKLHQTKRIIKWQHATDAPCTKLNNMAKVTAIMKPTKGFIINR